MANKTGFARQSTKKLEEYVNGRNTVKRKTVRRVVVKKPDEKKARRREG